MGFLHQTCEQVWSILQAHFSESRAGNVGTQFGCPFCTLKGVFSKGGPSFLQTQIFFGVKVGWDCIVGTTQLFCCLSSNLEFAVNLLLSSAGRRVWCCWSALLADRWFIPVIFHEHFMMIMMECSLLLKVTSTKSYHLLIRWVFGSFDKLEFTFGWCSALSWSLIYLSTFKVKEISSVRPLGFPQDGSSSESEGAVSFFLSGVLW